MGRFRHYSKSTLPNAYYRPLPKTQFILPINTTLTLERAVARFVDYYNRERLHEAICNVTPDDMYHGRQREIFSQREKIKRLTLEGRRKESLRNAA
jgi:hypothetical protein